MRNKLTPSANRSDWCCGTLKLTRSSPQAADTARVENYRVRDRHRTP
jgi:hypothetical protein